MKGALLFILLLFLMPLSAADGCLHIWTGDKWQLTPENQQYALIDHQDGVQRMLLTVDTSLENQGEKAVWIFPVPARPEETQLGIVSSFPKLRGNDILKETKEDLSGMFWAMRSSQILPMPFMMFGKKGFLGTNIDRMQGIEGIEGLEIHQSIEQHGVTTELITSTSSLPLAEYMTSKGVELAPEAKAIFDGYIGGDYSFVVTWVSNVTEFRKSQDIHQDEYGYYPDGFVSGNLISVSLTFPSEKIFFPLRPTSVYGNQHVPAIIYVLDYVEPELYAGIEDHTTVNYYQQSILAVDPALRPFFSGHEIEDTLGKSGENIGVRNVRYTKLSIDAPSYAYTEDLWIGGGMPLSVRIASFLQDNMTWIGFVLFFLLSALTSVLLGMLLFRRGKWWSWALLGLTNIFTLFGVALFTNFWKTKVIAQETLDYIRQNGTVLFKDPRRSQFKALAWFIGLFFAWLLLGRIDFGGWMVLFWLVLLVAILRIIFVLSHEYLKHQLSLKLRIIDLKKFLLLMLFNTVVSTFLLYLANMDYQMHNSLAKYLGFYDAWVFEGQLEFLIVIFVFTISLLLLFFSDHAWRRNFGMKGMLLLAEDPKKILFVALFSVAFIILTVVFQYLLQALV